MDLLRVRDGGVRAVYESFLWNVIDEGRAIAAEIVRLADLVPPYIVDPAKTRFKQVLLDFNYFVNIDQYDTALALYQDLDDEILAENRVLLANLVNLFNALATFINTFKQYMEESVADSRLEEWDTVRELELEAMYLVGVVCLSLERAFTSQTLERVVVLLFRLSDERSSGIVFALDFLHSPQNGDDTLFSRVGMPPAFVEEILEVFGDRFHEIQVHSQSLARLRPLLPGLLFVCLRFGRPATLQNTPRLSRILDLFFRDQWAISIGGIIVNLLDEWAQHKLLTSLLSSRVNTARARSLAEAQLQALRAVDLPQGTIKVSTLPSVGPLISKYNTPLQWLCLHTYDKPGLSKKATALLNTVKQTTAGHFVAHSSMAAVARVEQRFFTVYERCVRTRKDEIAKAVVEVKAKLDEVIEVLNVSPNLPLKPERKAKLVEWFRVLQQRLEEEAAGPKGAELAVEVKQRVDHVLVSVGLSLTLAAVQPRLVATLDALHSLASLSRQQLRTLKAAAAPTYAVEMLPSWSAHLQGMLVDAPLPLRALCYKLFIGVGVESSAVRSSNRRGPVQRALSARLSRRLRSALSSLPQQIFEVMDTCLLPSLANHWPTALDKSEVRRLADIDERLKLAEGTRALGNLSLGVSSLSARSLGGDPREVRSKMSRSGDLRGYPTKFGKFESGPRKSENFIGFTVMLPKPNSGGVAVSWFKYVSGYA